MATVTRPDGLVLDVNFASMTWTLSGLSVTPEQARRYNATDRRFSWSDASMTTIMDLEITESESREIFFGRDPHDVLLPVPGRLIAVLWNPAGKPGEEG
jgi:hypothetical protein